MRVFVFFYLRGEDGAITAHPEILFSYVRSPTLALPLASVLRNFVGSMVLSISPCQAFAGQALYAFLSAQSAFAQVGLQSTFSRRSLLFFLVLIFPTLFHLLVRVR